MLCILENSGEFWCNYWVGLGGFLAAVVVRPIHIFQAPFTFLDAPFTFFNAPFTFLEIGLILRISVDFWGILVG